MIASVRTVFPKASAALLLATAAMALGLSGCESPPAAPPPPPPVAALPPPPPVLLPRSIVEQASVYEAYVHNASAINPDFTAGESVAQSLRTGETYEIGQFQRGQTAYGAIVALQQPTFVASLREYAKDPVRRDQVARQILADPAYVTTFMGSQEAAGLVIAAFSEHGQKLIGNGARIRQAAYDVQHKAWSKADVPDRPGRLALAKSLSSQEQKAVEVDTLRLSQNASGAQAMGMSAPPNPGPYTPTVVRALSVAAMAAIGEGGDEYTPQLTALLSEPGEGSCLRMAKLNLYQCLAVSKPHYEDVFCLGQHAVSDTGLCVMKSAVPGYEPPAPVVKPTPVSDTKQHVAGDKRRKKKAGARAG